MRRRAIDPAARLEDAQLEQLPRIVPLVDRVADVQPLVALQADEIGPEGGRRGRGQRRLADAGFPFEEQRTPSRSARKSDTASPRSLT